MLMHMQLASYSCVIVRMCVLLPIMLTLFFLE